jgi:hypothetical protein
MPLSRPCLRRLFALLITLSVAGVAHAAEDGFVDLFNGRDLTGWLVEGTKQLADGTPVWSVQDGLLVCGDGAGKGFGFLRYDKPAGDFILHVEYRPAKRCNSGVGIRGVEFTGDIKTRPSHASFEVQIMDDAGKPTDVHSSGALYDYVAPTANAAKLAGEWNVLDIECRGPKIRVTLNGQTVQDIDQSQIDGIKDKPLRGYCSVQNHGRQIEFRNIRWKVLDAAAK